MNKFTLILRSVVIGLLLQQFLCSASCDGRHETMMVKNGTSEVAGEVVSRPGMTLKGRVVTEAGNGLPGVVVSDGITTTVTDGYGCYWLPSRKETGYVFVSVPGDYVVKCDGARPQFFQYTTLAANKEERHDFILTPVDNSSYVMLVHSDQHLAGRNNDVRQFRAGFLKDINATIAKYRSQSVPVYSISLGDMSWDHYWYANDFDISDSSSCFDKIECQVYHVTGNHDHDPYCSDDWLASAKFRATLAPTYYSFNVGNVHYVVLDNIVYNNTGGAQGVEGARDYEKRITDTQLRWLQSDLSHLPDYSTPVVVAAHVPFHKSPKLIGSQGDQMSARGMEGLDKIEAVLAGFSDVTMLSGHLHRNWIVESTTFNGLSEYNVASVCGTLWWTGAPGYAGNNICTDGSPGGYGVWEVNGTDRRYRYKSVGFDDNYCFRVYDLNTVLIDESCVGNAKYKSYVGDYADIYGLRSTANEILVNVFCFGPGWTVDITEEGRPLSVTRVKAKDPLHILSYECQCLDHGRKPTETGAFLTQNSIHFFKATAKSATSTVTVTVRDPWGRSYTQRVERPKAFGTDMK